MLKKMASMERLFVYGMVLTLISLHVVAGLDKTQLCRVRCLHGRGGILCKCSSMHFAGKRALSESSEDGSLATQSTASSSSRLPLPGAVALVSPDKPMEDSNFPFTEIKTSEEFVGSNNLFDNDIVQSVLPRLVNDNWGSKKVSQLSDESDSISSPRSGLSGVSDRIILPIIYINKNSLRRRPVRGNMLRSFMDLQPQRSEISPLYKLGSDLPDKKSFHSAVSTRVLPHTLSNNLVARRPLSMPEDDRHVRNLQLMLSQALEHR